MRSMLSAVGDQSTGVSQIHNGIGTSIQNGQNRRYEGETSMSPVALQREMASNITNTPGCGGTVRSLRTLRSHAECLWNSPSRSHDSDSPPCTSHRRQLAAARRCVGVCAIGRQCRHGIPRQRKRHNIEVLQDNILT